jgi:hypothetical protein
MLLIDADLQILRCSSCRATIDIPLRERGAHSMIAFRDRMARQHHCSEPAKQPQPSKQQTDALPSWASLWTPELLNEFAHIGQ